MEQNREYYAFISYQREDEQWAKWLQHKLEHYRLPSNLNGRTDLPREIRPVFRDTSELNPGNLPQQIHDALAASKHLIVVCSPRSASSLWVNLEVEEFIKMGKGDCIIPFIVDGRPFADDPSEECFPPAIRDLPKEQELLGANVNEMGRDAAAVKTVAQMFGVRFDSLWKRYEREQKRKWALVIAAVALFVLAVLGVAAYILRQNAVISKSRAELLEAYGNLSSAKDSIQAQYGIIQRTNADLSQAKDSIQYQYGIIEETNADLRRTNDARARAQSRAAAKAAEKLIETRDSYGAMRVALAALDISYTPEAELSLRTSSQCKDTKIDFGAPVKYASFTSNGHIIIAREYPQYDYSSPSFFLEKLDDGSRFPLSEYRSSIITNRTCSNKEKNKYFFCNLSSSLLVDIEKKSVISKKFFGLSSVKSIDLSPDTKNIVVSYSKGMAFLDASNLKIVDIIKYKRPNLNYHGPAKYSPYGTRIYSAEDSVILVWDVTKKECIDTLIGQKGGISEMAVSPKGDRIVTASKKDSTFRLWDVSLGKSIAKGYLYLKNMTISPDGEYLAAASDEDNDIVIWNINTKKFVGRLQGHTGQINSIEYSTDGGKIVSSSDDGTVRIWDLPEVSFDEINGYSMGTLHPDGTHVVLVCGENNNKIIIFDIKKKRFVNPKENHGKEITHVEYSSDGGQIVTSSLDSTVRIWDAYTGECKKVIGNINGEVYSSVLWSDNNTILICALDTAVEWRPGGDEVPVCSIRLRNIHNNKTFYTFCWEVAKRTRLLALFNTKSNIVVLQAYGGVEIWDAHKQRRRFYLEGHNTDITDIAINEEGDLVASSSKDHTVRLWSTETGECIKVLEHGVAVNSVSFSHNGKWLVTTSRDNTVRIWDLNSGRCLQTTHLLNKSEEAVFSKNDKSVVVVETNAIRIIDFPSLEDLVRKSRERFKDNPLTPEERRRYYLE